MANNVIQSEITILNFFFEHYYKYETIFNEDKKNIYDTIYENYKKAMSSLSNIITQLEPRVTEVTNTMRKQIELGLEEINELNMNGDSNEKITRLKREMAKTIKVYQEEKNFYTTKIERLENENKYMTEKLVKTGIQLSEEANSNSSREKRISNNVLTTSNISHQSSIGNQMLSSSNSNVLNSVGVTGARELTLNMMKDIIKEIYQSKIEYDKKCIECKLPRETMEQHMYNYLNTKYGLKNLVIEWASSIILGIKQYSSEDSDVCLFGKILRNEQEEESRVVLSKLRTTVNDLLEMKIKAKNPLKTRGEIQSIIKQKKEGFLLEEEWKGILISIHPKDEAEIIEKRIMKIIKNTNEEKKNNYIEKLKSENRNNILTREQLNQVERMKEDYDITYKEFMHVISEYQINYRDKYLKSFISIFQQYDTDRNGVIDESQFREMVLNIKCTKEKGERYIKLLLEKVDPYNYKRITFSECVTLFSLEMVDESNKKSNITLLDQICLDGDN